MRIVCWSGESKADGHGLFGQRLDGMFEAGREVGQALVEVAGLGGELDGLGHGAVALEGVEAEMGASGVEGHHNPAVVVVHRTVF